MREIMRELRGDLRLAARPACALVLVGAALLAGLSSAVMQDTSYLQLENASRGVESRVWESTTCRREKEGCREARDRGQAATQAFLTEQEEVAKRVGALQTPSGVLRFAASFMGLGTGAAVIALLATLTLAGEWARRTIGLALTGGVTAKRLALRRFAALCVLGLVALACVGGGAAAAALWGQDARPLPIDGGVQVLKPIGGALTLLVAYSATATAVTWAARDAMRTLTFTLLVVGTAAVTTSLGRYSPGALAPAALDIDRVLELEIGYLWVWPSLTFSRGDSPARLVEDPGWAPAVLVLLVLASVAILMLRRHAQRSDPLE